MRPRLLGGSVAALVVLAVMLVGLTPAATGRGHHGCGQVVVRSGSRTFVGNRFSVYQRVGCRHARAIVRDFLRQGHSLSGCEQGCRVGYRWLCFYEGLTCLQCAISAS
jgi:hypothetical protein